MKYYFIETHYEPTAANDRPDAVAHSSYHGAYGHYADTEPITGDLRRLQFNRLDTCQYNLDHAYKRPCDAARGLKSTLEICEWETAHGWWVATAKIVTVEM